MNCGITSGEAGQKYNLRPGAPNLIERIETGLKSYGQDMTIDSNPFEAALEKYMDLDKEAEYMCRNALADIAKTGPEKRLVNLVIEGGQLEAMRADWQLSDSDGQNIGVVTSKIFSPKFQANIAFAIVSSGHAAVGNTLSVNADGDVRTATIRNAHWQ